MARGHRETQTMPGSDQRGDNQDSLELVRRAQDGESVALNSLFGRYYGRVRRIVRARLGDGLRGRLDSEDIVQQTFVTAVLSFDRFEMRDEASLIHWLGKLAENEIRGAADHHGAMKRDQRREVAWRTVRDAMESGELELDPEGAEPQPSQEAVKREEVEAVEESLRALSSEYREVIFYRDYARASWAVVAESLGSPSPNAARMLYARALNEMRRLMKRRDGS